MVSVAIIILCVCVLICCHFILKNQTDKNTLKSLEEINKESFCKGLLDAILLATENKHKDISFTLSTNSLSSYFVLTIFLPEGQTHKEIISNIQTILNEVSFALSLFSSEANIHSNILRQNPQKVKEEIINRIMKIKGIKNEKVFSHDGKWFYTSDTYFSPLAHLNSFEDCCKYLKDKYFISLQIKVCSGKNTYYGFCPSLYPDDEITRKSFIIDFDNV